MSSVSAVPTTTVSTSSRTSLYSPSQAVPASVLDVGPVSQSSGNFVVNDVLEGVTTYNKLLYMSQHTAWDVYEAKFGAEATEKAKAADTAGIAQFRQNLTYEASGVGVSLSTVSDGGTGGTSSGGSTQTEISVVDGDYSSGSSTYSVSTGSDGTVSVQKDGQAWRDYDGSRLIASVENAGSKSAGEIAMELMARKGPVLSRTV